MTKQCKMCGMQIPEVARKCPHCHHLQNRWTRALYHPASAVGLLLFPYLIGGWVIQRQFLDQGESFDPFRDRLQVISSRVELGEGNNGPLVTALGVATNSSPVAWKEVRFHANFYDAQGKWVDVGTREDMHWTIPPHDAVTFKVTFRREFPADRYSNVVVRVLSAKDEKARW